MTIEWQTIVAFGIVSVAGWIVLSRLYQYLFGPESAKPGCGSCPSGGCSATNSRPLVQLQPIGPSGRASDAKGTQRPPAP